MVYEQYRKSKEWDLLSKHERWIKIADKIDLSKRAKVRLSWLIYYETKAEGNAALTCRYFGIGRSTFYKWKNRFNEKDLSSLESKSRKPEHVRERQAEPHMDQRVIKLRKKYINYGKMKLKVLYERKYDEKITPWYIQRVIEEYDLYPAKKKRNNTSKKSKNKKKVTELKKKVKNDEIDPEMVMHLDTIVLYRQGLKRYILTAVNSDFRIAYARMYKTKSSSSARDFLLRMHFLLDERVKHVHSDNGSEFHKHFEQAVAELDLMHWWSRPSTPKDNAKNERFNRTLQEEFLSHGNFRSNPQTFNQLLTEWLVEYNGNRPHQALDYHTPLQAFEGKGKVSTMCSSSTYT